MDKIYAQEEMNLTVKLALVVSRFNQEITDQLLAGALSQAKKYREVTLEVFNVPGAFELPLLAQKLAETKKYAGVVCLGAVIRGETSHYEYVCQQVSAGCQQVALKTSLPIIFGVLTTENEEQALERLGGQHGHKGKEAIDAALQMIREMRKVKMD